MQFGHRFYGMLLKAFYDTEPGYRELYLEEKRKNEALGADYKKLLEEHGELSRTSREQVERHRSAKDDIVEHIDAINLILSIV